MIGKLSCYEYSVPPLVSLPLYVDRLPLTRGWGTSRGVYPPPPTPPPPLPHPPTPSEFFPYPLAHQRLDPQSFLQC